MLRGAPANGGAAFWDGGVIVFRPDWGRDAGLPGRELEIKTPGDDPGCFGRSPGHLDANWHGTRPGAVDEAAREFERGTGSLAGNACRQAAKWRHRLREADSASLADGTRLAEGELSAGRLCDRVGRE